MEEEVRELLKNEFDLEIPNFRKWNPDMKHRRNWFALASDFYVDPKIIQLSMSERGWWLHLLAMYARSPSNLRRTTSELLSKSVGSTGQGPSKSLLKLAKLGLIKLARSSLYLQDRQDKQDRQDRGEKILPDLLGIDDGFFSKMPLNSQAAWLRDFGIELIREHLPTAKAAYEYEPEMSGNGRRKNLVYFLGNSLRSQKEYRARQPGASSSSVNYEEACKK